MNDKISALVYVGIAVAFFVWLTYLVRKSQAQYIAQKQVRKIIAEYAKKIPRLEAALKIPRLHEHTRGNIQIALYRLQQLDTSIRNDANFDWESGLMKARDIQEDVVAALDGITSDIDRIRAEDACRKNSFRPSTDVIVTEILNTTHMDPLNGDMAG